MKMNFRRKNESRGSTVRFVFSICTLALIIFVVFFRTTSNGFFSAVVSPFWKMSAAVGESLGGTVSSIFWKSEIERENISLRQEITTLQSKLIKLTALQSENAILSVELGRKPKGATHLAAVVLRPPTIPYDTLLLDMGSSSGIQVGDRVIAGEGIEIGTIAEVSAETSKVTLFSTSKVETKAIVRDTLVPITLVGKGGGVFEARIPQEISVKVGDSITTLPGSFVLAEVGSIEPDPQSAYRKALARVPVNLSSVHTVFIIPK